MYIYIMYKYVYITKGSYTEGGGEASKGLPYNILVNC